MRQQLTVLIIFLLTISGALAFVVWLAVQVEANVQEAPFDHSQCQYPERSTNPPNGCDNSDPCDPQDAVKGGSGECSGDNVDINETEPAKKPTITPVAPVEYETPKNVTDRQASQEACGK